MNIFKRLSRQPRWRLITAGVVVVALVGGVTAVALIPRSGATEAAPTGTPRPVPSATPTATTPPVVLLPTANVTATFDGWSIINEEDTASTLTAEAGDPGDGKITLRLDSTSPPENTTRRALTQVVAVTPSTEYTFSAAIKTASEDTVDPSVSAIVGATGQGRYDFTKVNAVWDEQSWSYTTAADETALPITIATVAPTVAVSLDSITMTAADSTDNLLANPSFESFTAPTRITNDSLLLATGEAAIGVSWKIPGASWTISDETGASVDAGTVDLEPGLGVVSLQDLDPGYYALSISNNDDANDVIATSLAILDPVAANTPTQDERFGVGVHLTEPFENSGQVTADLGISVVRTDAKWSRVEATKGVYEFPENDNRMIKEYEDAGVDLLPISAYGNKLYDKEGTPSSPSALAAYGQFTNKLVEQYGAPEVEIYNEFNNPPMNYSACGRTAECYVPLLKAGYDAVKANHPEVKIIGPAIARQDDAWLTALYQAGGLQYLDAISFHPYDYTVESGPEFMEASLEQVVNRIKEYNNGETKPIWITELGWSTTGFTEQDQADNLVRVQAISFANSVEKFFWYDLVNDSTDTANHEGNFGLLHQVTERVPAFAPKPSAVAEAVMIRQLNGKAFTARDALADSTVYSYAFGTGADSTRVAWATSPKTVTYAADEDITLTDQFGASSTLSPVDGRITVELSGHPVYLTGLVTDLQPGA